MTDHQPPDTKINANLVNAVVVLGLVGCMAGALLIDGAVGNIVWIVSLVVLLAAMYYRRTRFGGG